MENRNNNDISLILDERNLSENKDLSHSNYVESNSSKIKSEKNEEIKSSSTKTLIYNCPIDFNIKENAKNKVTIYYLIFIIIIKIIVIETIEIIIY